MRSNDEYRVVWRSKGGWPQEKVCRSRFRAELLCRSLVGATPAVDYLHVEHCSSVSDWTKVVRFGVPWNNGVSVTRRSA
jgi:hypothetical protein